MDNFAAMLRKKPAFRNLPLQKRRLLEEMGELMTGKDQMQCIQIFLAYRMRMQNEGLILTASESALMKDCLLDMLAPEERAKAEWMLNSL